MSLPFEDEEWRPVVGYEDRYLVSNCGRVKSLLNTKGNPWKTERLISTYPSRGYPAVNLWRKGELLRRPVHLLMLEAFVGPRPEGLIARHADDVRSNCTLANLSWATWSENAQDVVRFGHHQNANKTHCKRGHAFAGENLYLDPRGRRRCQICRRAEYQVSQLPN